MSKRPTPTSTRRLERRAEREARQPGANTPRARRQRASRTPAKPAGRFANVNWLPIIVGLGAVAIVAFLIYAVTQNSTTASATPAWDKAAADQDSSLPGQYIAPNPGADNQYGTSDDRKHFTNGQKVPICTADQLAAGKIADPSYGVAGVCYTSNPPTSGPHAESPMPFKILDNPAPKENLIHNMEHGGVVVWYNSDDPAVIKQLTDFVQGELDRKRLVVMSKYTEMEPNTIALTAWTRLDKFPAGDLTKKRVTDFIEEHSRRFNPEGF